MGELEQFAGEGRGEATAGGAEGHSRERETQRPRGREECGWGWPSAGDRGLVGRGLVRPETCHEAPVPT